MTDLDEFTAWLFPQAERDKCEIDLLLYGNCVTRIVDDRIQRVPPEDWDAIIDHGPQAEG